jgi:pyrroloquinoline quinone (PQQ) biosynthesis protein C
MASRSTFDVASRFTQAESLQRHIARLLQRRPVLRHPFCERWLAGELRDEDLQLFAGEHYHAVVAVATVSRRAAAMTGGLLGAELSRLAEQHAADIESWCEFALAAGWSRSAAWYFGQDPLPEAVACARTWAGGSQRPLAQHLVTLYAVASMQAAHVRPQCDALIERYGFREPRYFVARAERAADEAAIVQAALTSMLPLVDLRPLLGQAKLVRDAYWQLLNGVARAAEPQPAVIAAGRSGGAA